MNAEVEMETRSGMSGYGIPVMDSWDLAVIDAASAFVDQLGAFNDLRHPEVVECTKRLAEAISDRHNKPQVDNSNV